MAKAIPFFDAQPLKAEPGGYVRVSWPTGQTEQINGFFSEADANKWIDEKSEAWAGLHQ
jgi:hypothetical protein